MIFGVFTLCVLLSIASISIYLKKSFDGFVLLKPLKISLPLAHAQFSGISNGISSSIQTTLPSANFS